jgi:hypothetical protein
MTATPGEGQGFEWALTVTIVCTFAIVGVSLVKSIVDAHSLVLGVRRRVVHRKSVGSLPPSALVVGVGHLVKESSFFVNLEHDEDDITLDVPEMIEERAAQLDAMDPADARLFVEIERQFWDANGVARLEDVGGSSGGAQSDVRLW